MSGIFAFASKSHSVWSPLATRIHAVVWKHVGLSIVQGFVRQWASDLQPDDELPLPLEHRSLSLTEKWAGLAAIHDFYWKGDKINPWPLPTDQENHETWTKWHGNVFDYKRLMARVGHHLVDDDEAPVVSWLEDVTTESAPLVAGQAGGKPEQDAGKLDKVPAEGNAFVEISDLARILFSDYPKVASDRERERQNIEFARNGGAKHLEDAARGCYTEWDKVCEEYARSLWRLADLVAKRLPKIYEDLRLVRPFTKWHTEREFDWTAAEKELRRIEAAALQAAEQAGTDEFQAAREAACKCLWQGNALIEAATGTTAKVPKLTKVSCWENHSRNTGKLVFTTETLALLFR